MTGSSARATSKRATNSLTWHNDTVPARLAALTALLTLAGGLSAFGAPPEPAPTTSTSVNRPAEPTALELEEPQRLLAVITKERAISPLDYEPDDLVPWDNTDFRVRAEVHDQLELMFAAAQDEGLGLRVISGYRSHDTQAGTYDWWLRHYGRSSADATSARAGHSEHQTGLAVDLDSTSGECYLDQCFGATDEGDWVARHAHEFGFVISYPQGAREATGYTYEPWHIRYVGPQVAADMHSREVTLLQDYVSVPASSVRLGETLGSRG